MEFRDDGYFLEVGRYRSTGSVLLCTWIIKCQYCLRSGLHTAPLGLDIFDEICCQETGGVAHSLKFYQ